MIASDPCGSPDVTAVAIKKHIRKPGLAGRCARTTPRSASRCVSPGGGSTDWSPPTGLVKGARGRQMAAAPLGACDGGSCPPARENSGGDRQVGAVAPSAHLTGRRRRFPTHARKGRKGRKGRPTRGAVPPSPPDSEVMGNLCCGQPPPRTAYEQDSALCLPQKRRRGHGFEMRGWRR